MEYYHKLNTIFEKSVKLVKSGKISEGKLNFNFIKIRGSILDFVCFYHRLFHWMLFCISGYEIAKRN